MSGMSSAPIPLTAEQAIPQNVQVVGQKRFRVDDQRFVDNAFSEQKKERKLDDDDGEAETDQVTKYFKMAGFPPLAHPMNEYKTIVERHAYTVIFAELMGKVKSCFDINSDANMLVTGNPGTGKSRFYLYCIFQIVFGHQEKVKELGSFDLVLNFENKYHKFDAENREFITLNKTDVSSIQSQRRVLRLIEGKSSELNGWTGVSILFASPGLDGLNDYLKVNSVTYIMPVWSLEELQDCNALLDDDLKVPEAVLISRYDKFGGIPRFIFTVTEEDHNHALQTAIGSFNALDIISYAKQNDAVRDKKYSHRILEMVPTSENFRTTFHLDFLSKHIAEEIVAKVGKDSLQKISEFAIAHANDDSGSTSVCLGKIYELLCHKWFTLHTARHLKFRSLGQTTDFELIITETMTTVSFSTLDEISVNPQCFTYFWPRSRTFGALDAFILDGKNMKCYGLQMTLNRNHGIKAAPLSTFFVLAGQCWHFAGRVLLLFCGSKQLSAHLSEANDQNQHQSNQQETRIVGGSEAVCCCS